ncbi:GntR family transcriptional regulator [Lacisediminimonas profundi]|uniref:GntR family transcriptional regulator n=1 Tax=Lacisediminimonas profundi TaxID=2603856 RepID=UPI00124B144E|nr:GntR family transcriptional regulator [Lacisediminimonas profundi]
MTNASRPPVPAAVKVGQQHLPLFALIRDTLRQRILSGELANGERLVETKLSEEMGASRIPVREALRALAAEGLVTIEPRRGACVAFYSDEVARDLIEVRATLEGLNAKLAAQRRTDKSMAELKQVLELGITAAQGNDAALLVELNTRFHELLATAAGNDVLTDMMRSLRDRTAMLFTSSHTVRSRQNWEEHAQVLHAVISGNAELAALLAAQHVHNVARDSFHPKQAAATAP